MHSSFKDFIDYMQTAFGLLAGLTAFFPLASLFIKKIPFPDNIRAIASISSSISSLFIIYLVFIVSRYTYDWSMGCLSGLISMMLFSAGIFCILLIVQSVFNTASPLKSLQKELNTDSETMMVLLHVVAFTCITTAFSILAASDFWYTRLN